MATFKFSPRRDLLNARLGPPGGSKGYGAITGSPPVEGHGVVWWINDKIMPEVHVERGKTYYFRVQVMAHGKNNTIRWSQRGLWV